MSEPLLRIWNLTKVFPLKGGLFAVKPAASMRSNGVDFHIEARRNPGAGWRIRCGKSTTGVACFS